VQTPQSAIITGKKEVETLSKYMELLPTTMSGPFFRLLKETKEGTISSTLNVIGIHKLEGTGKRVAIDLHLENPEAYISHCLRRTAINMCVEAGMPITEIKLMTGMILTDFILLPAFHFNQHCFHFTITMLTISKYERAQK
jgi:hypothetical protein